MKCPAFSHVFPGVLRHICNQRWRESCMAYTCSLTCSSPPGFGLADGEFVPEHRRNSSPKRYCKRMKCPNVDTTPRSFGGSREADTLTVIFGPSSPTAANARCIGTPCILSSMLPKGDGSRSNRDQSSGVLAPHSSSSHGRHVASSSGVNDGGNEK